MGSSILQGFLDNQFIQTDDNDHIENLQKASAEIQKLLKQKKNKDKIVSYVLVSLDPNISDTDYIVCEVEGLLIKQWPTFKNSVLKTKDKPISYIRAVILDALESLSSDINTAAIIWYSGCNIVKNYRLAGQEVLLTNFLLEIGRKVEEYSHHNWGVLDTNNQLDNLQPIEFSLPRNSSSEIDQVRLKTHLLNAAVHSAHAAQAGGGLNPRSPSFNNHEWAKFFAENAASAISEEINSVLSDQSQSLGTIGKALQELISTYFESIEEHLNKLSSSLVNSSQSLNKRNDLLWWRQSLYSSRLDLGYRSLASEPLVLAMLMALDLSDRISSIYPKSVDFFLLETLRDILGDKLDESIDLKKLIEQLPKLDDDKKLLLDRFTTDNSGRKLFLECIADILAGKTNKDDFFNQTGIDKHVKLSIGSLTCWIFHDIHAFNLADSK